MFSIEQYSKRYSIIGYTPIDIVNTAWGVSRNGPSESIEDIVKIDAPVNEIPTVVFTYRCTVLVREILASARNHVMWARTSRVDNPLSASLSPNVSPKSYQELNIHYEEMRARRDAGESQDTYRYGLPVNSMTTITLRMDLRSLLKMAYYFQYLYTSLESKNELRDFLEAYQDLIDIYCTVTEGHVNNIPSYKTDYLLYEGESLEEVNTIVGNQVVVTLRNAPIALRAQLIRHRNLHITDTLLNYVETHDTDLIIIGDTIDIQISAPINIMRSLVIKRQCWIAQYGLWKEFINKVSSLIGVSQDSLPCYNEKYCPYSQDAFERVPGVTDPGAPCPKFSLIYNQKLDDKQYEKMKKDVVNHPEYWTSIIEDYDKRFVL